MGGFSPPTPALLDVAVSTREPTTDAKLADLDANVSAVIAPAGQNVSAAQAAHLNAALSSVAGAITVIQRGSIVFTSQGSGQVTLSSIDTSKSVERNLGCADATTYSQSVGGYVQLTSATTLNWGAAAGATGNTGHLGYEVVTYAN